MSAKARIVLVSAVAAQALDEDLPPLLAALREAGANAVPVNWDDAQADWAAFDLAVLRSSWDYTARLQEFLGWAQRAAACTTLLNPLSLLRWNIDKHYLQQLSQQGVHTVPSRFVEPGADAAGALDEFLATFPGSAELVVKPAIGAGSRDAERHSRDSVAAIVAHIQRLLDAQRSVLLQPYLDRVDDHGETALIFFAGQYSHAIRKGPLLKRGQASTSALFAPEEITPRTPGDDELQLARQVIAKVPGGAPLYARVDLIRDTVGAPCVLELELAEPSLFFVHAPGAAARFAASILAAAGLRRR